MSEDEVTGQTIESTPAATAVEKPAPEGVVLSVDAPGVTGEGTSAAAESGAADEPSSKIHVDTSEIPVEQDEGTGGGVVDAAALESQKSEFAKSKGPKIPLPGSLQEIVGALLFASETPLTAAELRTCVRGVAPEEGEDAEVMGVYQSCTNREIEQALRGLEKELERSSCGFRLVCTGGTYRMQTAPACGRYVRALLKLDRPSRLSRASLETLAIIAYRQPITKAEIEQIRGVAVDTIVKSLVDLQLVRLVGRSELPGHPFLYGTSPLFLEHFGLASLSELNAIDPTLQRSNPRERAKLFVKEKKAEEPTELEAAAQENAAATAEAPAAENVPTAVAVNEGEDTENAPDSADEGDTGTTSGRRVSFRLADDEDGLIDDTPDEVVDGDDESLTDGGDDDESLTDDEDESLTDDEDESLTDDDESLTDDDDDEDDDDEDDEEDDEEETSEGGDEE